MKEEKKVNLLIEFIRIFRFGNYEEKERLKNF